MPLLINRVPTYRLHKQSGQAIVTLNGRDHLLGKHGSAATETASLVKKIGEMLPRRRKGS